MELNSVNSCLSGICAADRTLDKATPGQMDCRKKKANKGHVQIKKRFRVDEASNKHPDIVPIRDHFYLTYRYRKIPC